MVTKTFCDKCGQEIKGTVFLVIFGKDEHYNEGYSIELCNGCARELEKFLGIKIPEWEFQSLRDKQQIILRELIEAEKASVTGLVPINSFIERINVDYGIPKSEISKIIGQLIRDGTIYVPKEGFLKKT